jgi:UDP:flavonoid glycosyltransferase YjiC (YdhE family)
VNSADKPTALLAWELGGNLGHVLPLLEVAKCLSAKGWRCVFALCDLTNAFEHLSTLGYEFFQAPASRQLKVYSKPAVSFAEELLRVGYSSHVELAGLVRGWQFLIAAVKPDLLILDLAPTAALVAKAKNLPTFVIGNGYGIPPAISPWPAYPLRQRVTDDFLIETEQRLLTTIQQACALCHLPPLKAIKDLFPASSSIICSVPELDHYPRVGGTYVGVTAVTHLGVSARWPVVRGSADKGPPLAAVFVYLQSSYPLLAGLMQALADADVQVVAFISGLTESQRKSFERHNIWLSEKPICVDEVLPACRFAICHGGNLAQAILLKGVPILVLPMQLEQAMLGMRITALGAGLSCAPDSPREMAKLIKQLVVNSNYKEKAMAFAARNAEFVNATVFQNLANRINAALSR